jgi:hypothetical protein
MLPEDGPAYDHGRDEYLQNQADLDNDCEAADRAGDLLAALKDISFGADIVLQLGSSGAIGRYATEVKRVADAAIAGAKS